VGETRDTYDAISAKISRMVIDFQHIPERENQNRLFEELEVCMSVEGA
jgi:thermostable 8-oxoguanine DNA glycosylase